MTYSYYRHTVHTVLNEGTQYENRYDVVRESLGPDYPVGPHSVVTKTEEVQTEDTCVAFQFAALLFGRYYQVSEEHSGTYVFDKEAWLESGLDESWMHVVRDYDWDDTCLDPSSLGLEGRELVVLDFGGQLESYDPEDDYWYPVDEATDLPELPWNALVYELCDVGNG